MPEEGKQLYDEIFGGQAPKNDPLPPVVEDQGVKLFQEVFGSPVNQAPAPDAATGALDRVTAADNQQRLPVQGSPEAIGEKIAQTHLDAPMPKNIGEALRAALDHGVNIQHYPELHQDINNKAEFLTMEALTMLGLSNSGQIDTADFIELTNAYRYIATIAYSPLSPDEVPRAAEEYVRTLTTKGMDIAKGKLQTLYAKGEMDSTTAKRLQQQYSILKSYHSRAGDTEVQRQFLSMAGRVIPQTLSPPNEAGMRDLRVSTNTIGWAQQHLPPPEAAEPNNGKNTLPASIAGNVWGPEGPLKELFRDVNAPRAPATIMKDAWDLAQERAKLRMLGLPEQLGEVSRDDMSLSGAIAITHAPLVQKVVQRIKSRQISRENPGLLTPGFEKFLRKRIQKDTSQAFYDLLTDRRLSALADRIKYFDPQGIELFEEGGVRRAGKHVFMETVVPMYLEGLATVDSILAAAGTGYTELKNKAGPDAQFVGRSFLSGAKRVPLVGSLLESIDSGLTVRDQKKDLTLLRQQMAQGNMDPQTLLRVAAGHRKAGLLTNLSFFAAAKLGGAEVAGRLQKLAAEAPEKVTANLVITALEAERTRAVKEILDKGAFISQEEMEQADNVTARALREQRFWDWAGAGLRSAVFRISTEMREAIEFTVERPNSLPLNIAAGYGMKAGFTPAKDLILKPIGETFSRATQASRARRAMADLIYNDPEAAAALRDSLRKVRFSEKTDAGQRQALEAAEAMASAVDLEHRLAFDRLDEPTKTMKKRRLAGHVRKTRRVLNQVAPETLREIFDEMGTAQGLAQWVKRPGFHDVLKQFSNEVVERLQLNKRQLYPDVVQSSENLAKKIDEIVSDGGTVEAALQARDALPFSLDGLDGGAGPLRNWVDGKLRSPLWDKLMRNPGAVRTGEFFRTLAETATKHLAFLKEWRILQGHQRVNQTTILQFLREKYRSRLDSMRLENTVARKAGEEIPHTVDALREVESKFGRTRQARDTLEGRPWDQEVRLSENDYMDDLTLHDWDALISDLEPQGELRAAWRRVRRKDESFDEFESQWNRALRDPEAEDSLGFQTRVKRAFAKLYSDSQGLGVGKGKDQFLPRDMDTGQIMLPAEAARIHRQRKATFDSAERARERIANFEGRADLSEKQAAALARARRTLAKAQEEMAEAPDLYDPATNFGFERLDSPEKLKEMRRWRARFEAGKRQGLLQRFNEMDTGSVKDWLQTIKNSEASATVNLYARNWKIARQIEAYQRLTNAKKKAFNDAIDKWADGDPKDLHTFARDNPDIFHGSHSPEENIQRLFKEGEEFRQMLLREMRDAEMISQADYESLVDPYAPHMYATSQATKILRDHSKGIRPENFYENGTEAGTKGLDLSELMAQRDLTMHRVIIRTRGQKQVSKKFNSQEEALEWLRDSHGIKGDPNKLEGGKGLAGTTELGDEFKVLDPVGMDRALRVLELQPTAEGLLNRLSTIMRDVQLYKYLKSFDRPGWVLNDAEFKALRLRNPQEGKQWVRLPNTRDFGPLRGKIVARPLAKQMRHFFSIHDDMSAMFKGLSEAIEPLFPVVSRGLAMLDPATAWMRRSLAKNAISRNLLTLATNYLMDMQMFGRMGFGEDFLYHPDGQAARQFAFKVLFNSDRGGWLGVLARGAKNPKKLIAEVRGRIGADAQFSGQDAAIFEELFERGVFGEQLVGDILGDDAKRATVQMVYGSPDPSLPKRGAINSAGSNYDTMKEALMVTENNQLAALRGRVERIDKLLDEHNTGVSKLLREDREAIEVERAIKLNAIADLQREQLSLSPKAFVNFLGRALGVTDKKGLAGTAKSFSKEFYARTGNMTRVAGYHFLRKRGWSPDEAIKEVNKFTQNYSGVPAGIQALSRSPFGSAITSFPYEMARITANWLAERPLKYGAMLAAIPAVNMFTMAAGGIDPFAVYEAMGQSSGGLPAGMAMATTLLLPTGVKGEYSTHQLPAINPFILARSPYGILSGAVEREDLGDGLLGLGAAEANAELLAFNFASKFALSQPLTSALVNTAMSRDPISGRQYNNFGTGAWENTKDIMALMVPPWTPWVGRNAQDLHEIPRRPPNMRTGVTVSKFESLAQVVGGVRSRGGLWDRLANEIPGGRRALDTVTNIVARAAVAGAYNPLPEYQITPKAMGKNGTIASLMWQGRKLDAGGNEDFDMPIERASEDLRLGLWHMREGVEKGEPKQVEYGKRIRDRALAELNERDTTRAKLFNQEFTFGPKRSKITGELLPTRENVAAINRVLKSMDFENLSRSGPIVQAYVLTHIAAMPSSSKQELQQLLKYVTRTPSGAFSGAGDTRRLEEAEALVDAYLQNRRHDNGIQELESFRRLLTWRKAQAARREIRSFYTESSRREAFKRALEGIE